MLIIGSKALVHNLVLPNDHPCKDLDIIGAKEELDVYKTTMDVVSTTTLGNTEVIKLKSGLIIEWEVAKEGNSGYDLLAITNSLEGLHYASVDVCYALKMSHRFKKDSPHFLKTMKDIRMLRRIGASITPDLSEWFVKREKETYNYDHPRLDVSKGDFFKEDDGVPYIYDHDSIHLVVAQRDYPAYLDFKPQEEDVLCCREMFEECSLQVKLNSVLEEAMVLTLERSLVPLDFRPDPHKMFKVALSKVCTSITSGWWREFAWEHYYEVLAAYNKLGDNYLENMMKNHKGLLKPFKNNH